MCYELLAPKGWSLDISRQRTEWALDFPYRMHTKFIDAVPGKIRSCWIDTPKRSWEVIGSSYVL